MAERKGTKGLELWCRKMTEGYPGVKIDNMTTSWRDGLAFCAIIHHFRPDLIEFDKLNKDDIYHNNELAFRVAEHHLGIPALLEPEDMVEYEVPDRLSILTYLSQFYQTFENQRGKSGARIAPKRPQSTPDHGIVSPASTSPPTKVHIGRAKREPCAKCGLPVFIAERLNVGKLLYHRTCFRCARCNSQLTLANYYETENNEFCCETCPDEEKIISKKRSSEHSVLMRSMSDEDKSASLQTYSNAPDPYSTHFETSLEYPVDDELKRNFTLSGPQSTEFTHARSHFFKSQIEDSSDSGSEDIPPDLPQSKPPPTANSYSGNLKTNNSDLVRQDSSFPGDKKDTNVISDSVSEQTDDHFVTKDNASSTSGISVRARMKLFENNKDKKSDVNSDSSSKQVPFDLTQKKKATVVAIDDLEDFNIISKKDTRIDTPLDKSSNSKEHSNVVGDIINSAIINENLDISNDFNLELNQNSNFIGSKQLKMEPNNFNVETKIEEGDIQTVIHKNDIGANQEQLGIIEILDSSQEQEPSIITIDSDREEIIEIIDSPEQESNITIDDSYDTPASIVSNIIDDSYDIPVSIVSDDNIISPQSDSSQGSTVAKRGYHTAYEVVSPTINSSPDSTVAKRGYYTAYEVLSPTENININYSQTNSSQDSKIEELDPEVLSPTEDNSINSAYTTYEVVSPSENNNMSLINDGISSEKSKILDNLGPQINEDITTDKREPAKDLSFKETVSTATAQDIKMPIKDTIPLSNEASTSGDLPTAEHVNTENNAPKLTEKRPPLEETVPSKEIPPQINDDLAPRRDETVILRQECNEASQVESPNIKRDLKSLNDSVSVYPEVLNPFDDDTEEDSSAVSPSLNPFGEPNDDEVVFPQPVLSARPKKKIIFGLEEEKIIGTPEALSIIYKERMGRVNPFEDDDDKEEKDTRSKNPVPSPRPKKKLLFSNPFESDEDTDKNVPVPAPRTSKASPARPEPKPRDTLSVTSRGSHGGSNSSISSGSAVGSTRKKKPAPRPPVPFRNSEQAAHDSLTISPFQSLPQSPNLSGTMRSRKTKRAPLPPNASTPNTLNVGNYLPSGEISPINLENTDASPVKSAEDHIPNEKNVKNEENRNKQTQNPTEELTSNEDDTNLAMLNKSTSGRWKRRKGQAPSRPIPQKRTIKSLPMSEIKRELDTIEIQQQGLEKQGVRLEQIIREKCEGDEGTNPADQVPIEVEDLILQLFELVNEKNELFRRQAELMYLRRQQRLEEEHADVEYQIRCLMLQPEVNKPDSDKAREEVLIKRLVEIVERKNEIIECLEMDRVRETEEDNSISSQLSLYTLKRDGEKEKPKEKEKKDKKKKHKKLTKIIHTLQKHKEKEKDHKVDIDKDVDETEVNSSVEKKKKKKFNLF